MTAHSTVQAFWCEFAWLPPGRTAAAVLIRVDGERFASVETDVVAPPDAIALPGLTLPGLALPFGLRRIALRVTQPSELVVQVLEGFGLLLGGAPCEILPERDAAALRARILPELGADYTPSTEQIVRLQEFGRAIRSAWGGGAALRDLLPSVRSTRQLAMLERAFAAKSGLSRHQLRRKIAAQVPKFRSRGLQPA